MDARVARTPIVPYSRGMPRQRLLRTVIACAILAGFAWLVAVPWALRTEQRSHAAAFVATSAHAEVVVARREVALGKATHLSKDHALRAHVAQDCVLLGPALPPASAARVLAAPLVELAPIATAAVRTCSRDLRVGPPARAPPLV